MMKEWFRRRRAAKVAREWLQHARLCRHMREDVARPASIDALRAAELQLRATLDSLDATRVEKECTALREAAVAVMPPKSKAGLRENLEVIVVALAVAMAFRCYFLQPFKIPTGSMQPTLYGIHYRAQADPGHLDQHPLRLLKWLIFGEWYEEIKADTAGRVRGPIGEGGGMWIYDIGGLVHRVPRDMSISIKAGDEVVTGQVIATGCRITGDHLFVNRVRWNFVRPQRGDVMVFRTDDIPALDDKKTHYIKRLCGLPGESVGINPPNLMINGRQALDHPMIRRVTSRERGYSGYTLASGAGEYHLRFTNDVITLNGNQYLAFGDNTQNSFDSRYWGPVPARNLVGPAMIVYWPLSCRWGRVQ
jgi:signal peptidase I